MTTKKLVRIVTAVLMAAALVSLLPSCRPHVSASFSLKTQENVLLITVSGLCADHLGCYSYLIDGTSPKLDRALFAESFFQRAVTVREGEYKFIRYHDTMMSKEIQNASQPSQIPSAFYREPSQKELYNLKQDPGETQNLADESKKRVEEMNAQLDKWYSDSPYKEKDTRSPVNLPLLTRVRMIGY